ncbi:MULTISPECIES: gp53-like domain-containing protein [Providencia]|uniref:gp53-like domain-containing protein n=1 Tax=Providencia TaxID=586 RepID=UPI00234A302B
MSKPTGKLIRVTPEGIGAVSSGRKVNNKPLTADITLTATDVGAYTKAESDTKIADAKKAGTDAQSTANTANTNATNANNNANGRVPNTRKVNNKPLSADITLTAGDVGAYTKAEVDNKINSTGGKNSASKAASGWWKDSSTGIIIQWGTSTTQKDTLKNFIFPTQFPNACFSVTTTMNNASKNEVINVRSFTKDFFSAIGINGVGGWWDFQFTWMAIGH